MSIFTKLALGALTAFAIFRTKPKTAPLAAKSKPARPASKKPRKRTVRHTKHATV